MRLLLATVCWAGFVPLASAQVFPQAPAHPGLGVGAPQHYAPARPDSEGYGRQGGGEWRRQEELRREEWVRTHCRRGDQGVYCRR